MNFLIIGDVFGELGKKAISQNLQTIKKNYKIDFTIANCENVTKCRGLNIDDYHFMIDHGIDLITMGNHTWKQDDYNLVLSQDKIIRPLNINHNSSFSKIGYGYKKILINNKNILVINVLGKSIPMKYFELTNPYLEIINLIDSFKDNIDFVIIDFHAETTSEKNAALKIFSDYKKVKIIVGTHTHVQTNDAKIYNDIAYITDIGMTGPYDGIIGADSESLTNMFLDKSNRFKLTEATGRFQFCAVVINIDDKTNLPIEIKTINNIKN